MNIFHFTLRTNAALHIFIVRILNDVDRLQSGDTTNYTSQALVLSPAQCVCWNSDPQPCCRLKLKAGITK